MHGKAMRLAKLVALSLLEIRFDHGFDQFREADLRFPAEDGSGLGGIAEQAVYFGGPEVAGIDAHQNLAGASVLADFVDAGSAPFDRVVQFLEGAFDKFTDGVSFAGGDHVVVGGVLLQH